MRRLTISIEQNYFDIIEKKRKKQKMSASQYINFLIGIAFENLDHSPSDSNETSKNNHNLTQETPFLETLLSTVMETKYHVRRLIDDTLDDTPEAKNEWLEEAKKRANISAKNLVKSS